MANPLILAGAAAGLYFGGRWLAGVLKPKKAVTGEAKPPVDTKPPVSDVAAIAKACADGTAQGQADAKAKQPKAPTLNYSPTADIQAKYETCYGAAYDAWKVIETFELKEKDGKRGYIPPQPKKGQEKNEFDRGRDHGFKLGRMAGNRDGASAHAGITPKERYAPALHSGTTEYRNGFMRGWGSGYDTGYKENAPKPGASAAGVGGVDDDYGPPWARSQVSHVETTTSTEEEQPLPVLSCRAVIADLPTTPFKWATEVSVDVPNLRVYAETLYDNWEAGDVVSGVALSELALVLEDMARRLGSPWATAAERDLAKRFRAFVTCTRSARLQRSYRPEPQAEGYMPRYMPPPWMLADDDAEMLAKVGAADDDRPGGT